MQRVRRILRAFCPSPTQPLTGRSVLPLVAFLAVFLVLCFALDSTDAVAFTSLWPLGLLTITPWMWWMSVTGGTGLSRSRSTAALLVRLLLVGLLIVALMEPHSIQKDDRLTVVYAVDISGSVTSDAVDHAIEFVARVGQNEKPARDSSGLVYFGREAGVQLPPRSQLSPEELQARDVVVRREGTNLAQALSLSAAMLMESENGRIVLISDGVQTEGNLAGVLGELKSRGIAVDVLPIEYGYEEEVWLEQLQLPREVHERQTYEAGVIVSSLKAGRGKLVLLENNQKVLEQEITFPAGKSRFAVPIYLREPGYYEYTARLEPASGDHVRQNNTAIGSVYLEGRGRILLVTEPEGDPRDWESLARALKQAEFDVRQVPAYECPPDSLALKTYDAVIFLNVSRDAFDDAQMQAVHDAIYQLGVGFLMVGGPRSFGPGFWTRTPVEQALPVEMDLTKHKALLNGALILVIDHSGSMGGPVPGATGDKQQLANASAAAAIEILHPRDWLGVLSFDDTATWVVPFALNRDSASAIRRVRAIGTGGGTNMYPALENAVKALEDLSPGDAAVRHIVLLTDGQSLPGDLRGVVTRCKAAQISVSTIGVGGPGDVDTDLLKLIAQESGGRFYPVMNAQALPRILIREAVTLRKAAIREKSFTPENGTVSPILKGIEAVPDLHGLVVTVPKDRAELVLVAPSDGGEDVSDPVLAVHRHGLGRTAAFTSDLSPRWGKDWLDWNQYQAFAQQLLTDISRTHQEGPLQIQSFAAGGEGIIRVEDRAADDTLRDIRAVVRSPDRQTTTIPLHQTGPRRYEARFPLSGEGRYLIAASDADERLTDGFAVPYSPEYLRFTSNPHVLKQIASATDGRLLTGQENGQTIYGAQRQLKRKTQSLVPLLLSLTAILLTLDVGVRRIQIDWSLVSGWFRRGSEPATMTLATLRERRKAVAASMPQETPRPTLPRKSANTVAKPPPAKREPKPAENVHTPDPPGSSTPGSTTSHLLAALNRKRRKDKPE